MGKNGMGTEDFSDVQPLGHALRHANSAIESLIRTRIEEADIRFGQVRALDLVLQGSANTPGSLATAMGLTTGAMTRLIDRLENSGWLTRERQADDRRVLLLAVTESGKTMIAKVMPIVAKAWREVLSDFTQQEAKLLQEYLVKISVVSERLSKDRKFA